MSADWKAKLGSAALVVAAAFAAALEPPVDVAFGAWSEENVVLPSEAAATPGAWRGDVVPYMAEIEQCLEPSHPARRVVIAKGAQLAFTTLGNNWLMYLAANRPSPMLALQPTVEGAQNWHKEKLRPQIDASPAVRRLIHEQVNRGRQARDASTQRFLKFPGGYLKLSGANSAAGLRSSSIRYLMLDEVDEYPQDVEGQGDPVMLAETRQSAFYDRKSYLASTPTILQLSRIWKLFLDGDQRRFHVPCPHCGHEQVLVWGNLRFEREYPYKAEYACESCGVLIPHHHKREMLARGRWIAAAPGLGRDPSFHISTLYSPFETWDDLVGLWWRAQGDPSKLKGFTNTRLGEPWEEKGDAPDAERLMERAGPYRRGECPAGVLFLTAGVDVQADRLEVEIVGWGVGETSWSIDYRVLPGDTATPAPWAMLADLARESFPALDGGEPFQILVGFVDMGYRPDPVHAFTRLRHNWHAVRGVGGYGVPDVARPRKVESNTRGKPARAGAVYLPIGDWALKAAVYDRLRLGIGEGPETVPAGYSHFPLGYDLGHYQGLTAEALVSRKHKRTGQETFEWVKVRPRNEQLDVRKMALAAARSPWIGSNRMTPQRWAELAAARGVTVAADAPLAAMWNAPKAAPAAQAKPAAATAEAPAGGGWLNRREGSWL